MAYFKDGNISLAGQEYEDYISINNEDLLLSYLDPKNPFNKGASSNIFLLTDPEGEYEDRVIKICKSPFYRYSKDRRLLRFSREIRAFGEVQRKNINGIIGFHGSGTLRISGFDFKYIILEKADGDLASFMENNEFDFTINQRLNFCINILTCIQNLHNARIYHRDIKHDNILVIDGEMKIGDLGLVQFQDKDASMDRDNEKIGPAGWLSPEATNKMLTHKKNMGNIYDCTITNKSDIFQLGKLFWYIFQGNIPTGQIIPADMKFNDGDIYNIIFSMIQYDQLRRPTIPELHHNFEPIMTRLFV